MSLELFVIISCISGSSIILCKTISFEQAGVALCKCQMVTYTWHLIVVRKDEWMRYHLEMPVAFCNNFALKEDWLIIPSLGYCVFTKELVRN